jgi:hypothetical protein
LDVLTAICEEVKIMPKCAQCGKEAGRRISFNWDDGVKYLCSEECVESSKSWRLKQYAEKKQ